MNRRPQNLHSCGFSPLCIFLCRYKELGSAKVLPQISHDTEGLPFGPKFGVVEIPLGANEATK